MREDEERVEKGRGVRGRRGGHHPGVMIAEEEPDDDEKEELGDPEEREKSF